MVIAIVFNDNDFYSMFKGIHDTLMTAHRYKELTHDKIELLETIKSLVPPMLKLYQPSAFSIDTINYIMSQLTIDKLLIDSEYAIYMQSGNYHETYVLDTSLDYPGNSTFYVIN